MVQIGGLAPPRVVAPSAAALAGSAARKPVRMKPCPREAGAGSCQAGEGVRKKGSEAKRARLGPGLRALPAAATQARALARAAARALTPAALSLSCGASSGRARCLLETVCVVRDQAAARVLRRWLSRRLPHAPRPLAGACGGAGTPARRTVLVPAS